MRFFREQNFLRPYRSLFREHFHWEAWERFIEQEGITFDRPRGTAHPDYPHIVYPIDYGFLEDTISSDGEGIDVFAGTARTGLVGATLTLAHHQEKREVKLLYNCSPEEVYLVNGFLNFDRTLLEGILVLRWAMSELRRATQ